MVHLLTVQKAWYDEIASGRKTVEGRTSPSGRWEQRVGSLVKFVSDAPGCVPIYRRVVEAVHYPDLDSYLTEEWQKAAPQCRSFEAAREAYLSVIHPVDRCQVFSPERVEKRGGVVALRLELAPPPE